MKLQVHHQMLQKAGLAPSECEDAIATSDVATYETRRDARFAIADGATESVFSGLWAKCVVNAYRDAASPTDSTDHLDAQFRAASKEWAREVWSRPLTWPAQEKLARGSFASFVGLQFIESERKAISWSAVGFGDACLFVMRKNELLHRFPLKHSAEFTSHPFALCTDPAKNDWSKCVFESGEAQRGDCFLMMTDALAHWFLTAHENKRKQRHQFCHDIVADTRQFNKFVKQQRARRRLRNDDVTVISITLLDG